MFNQKLTHVLDRNKGNFHLNNFDFTRFGEPERDIVIAEKAVKSITPYLPGISDFYDLLEDENSKDLLILITAYRMLGHRKIKLPLSFSDLRGMIDGISKYIDTERYLEVESHHWKLFYGDFSPMKIPVKMYTMAEAVLVNFLLKQYEYQINENGIIGAEPNDIVLDAGACWGDTTLFFANNVGNSGRVYAFEFLPKNLSILFENLSLNPSLKQITEVIQHPLWEKSDIPMYFTDRGPSSRISFEPINDNKEKVQSVSIDDFVANYDVERVDFIKMDIEGSELPALKGAVKTLSKFKPKMAIAIYHSLNDFVNIIQYINNLNLGYKFYLGHYTIHQEETVLYCKADTRNSPVKSEHC